MRTEAQVRVIGSIEAVNAVKNAILSRFPDCFVGVPKPDKQVAGIYRLYISVSVNCLEEEARL